MAKYLQEYTCLKLRTNVGNMRTKILFHIYFHMNTGAYIQDTKDNRIIWSSMRPKNEFDDLLPLTIDGVLDGVIHKGNLLK